MKALLKRGLLHIVCTWHNQQWKSVYFVYYENEIKYAFDLEISFSIKLRNIFQSHSFIDISNFIYTHNI